MSFWSADSGLSKRMAIPSFSKALNPLKIAALQYVHEEQVSGAFLGDPKSSLGQREITKSQTTCGLFILLQLLALLLA